MSHTQRFKGVLRDATLSAESGNGKSYVLVDKLKRWLRSPGPIRPSLPEQPAFSNLDILLDEVHSSWNFAPVDTSKVLPALLIFSILLQLDHGHLIQHLLMHDHNDTKLPISYYDLRICFFNIRQGGHPEGDKLDSEALAKRFDHLQWQFCALKFSLDKDSTLRKNMVVPIHRRERISSKGATATIWRIEVLEEFVDERLRKAAENARYTDPNDDLGYRYQFVLKTFDKDKLTVFMNERESYRGLRGHTGTIKCLGSYTNMLVERQNSRDQPNIALQDTESGKQDGPYNLLLEHGDCDLDGYLQQNAPPDRSPEIYAFWKNIIEVAHALDGVHNLKSGRMKVKEFEGIVADLKPDNIIFIDDTPERESKFKLADLGFAKFVEKDSGNPETYVSGGTRAFGAPESGLYKDGQPIQVSPKIDIWSLGCVFSIAATWVVLGYNGILQYRKLREIATQQDSTPRNATRDHRTLQSSWRFHDGKDVLPEISHWHEHLRSVRRISDSITPKILDIVEQDMLRGKPEDRFWAKELYSKLQGVLKENIPSTSTTSSKVSDAILEFEKGVEQGPWEQASSEETHSLVANLGHPTKLNKPLSPPPLKTSYRSELIQKNIVPGEESLQQPLRPGNLDRSSFPTSPVKHVPPRRFTSEEPHATESTSPGKPWHRSGASNSYMPERRSQTTVQPQSSDASNKDRYQTVEQAREMAETELAERKKGPLGRFRFHKRKPDEFLSRNFPANRDLIFLVDNGGSMKEHWFHAIYLLETLVMKASGLDKDGMDLKFTSGDLQLKGQRDPAKFKAIMSNPKVKPQDNFPTDIRKALRDIFDHYERHTYFSRYREGGAKGATLIVLTDGIWDGVLNKSDVDEMIIDFEKRIERNVGDLKQRLFSIQFIQFGHDPEATETFRRLDDELKFSGVPDIIDTEPAKGNIIKMFLGSSMELFDDLPTEGDSGQFEIPHFSNRNGHSRSPTFDQDTTVSRRQTRVELEAPQKF